MVSPVIAHYDSNSGAASHLPLLLCILGLASFQLLLGCRNSIPPRTLRARILSAPSSQACGTPNACLNPHILAIEDGFVVTTFNGNQPEHARVSSNDLAKYLDELPIQAWPRGPSIDISPSDDSSNPDAVQRNVQSAKEVCGSLHLDVRVLMGG